MSRLSRRNRTAEDLGFISKGVLTDLFDNAIKEIYRINDDEYDYICEMMNDDELSIILNEKPTFTEAREMITLIEKHIANYNEQAQNI